MKILKLFFCFMVSGFCLLFVFRKVNIAELKQVLSHINYAWVAVATLIGILKMWITCFRWRLLGVHCKQLSLRNSFHFYAISTMINMTLPFRAGDVLWMRLIAENLQISNTKILATIASEHILDFIILCVMLVSCLVLYSYHWPRQIIPVVMTFFIIIIPLFFGMLLLNKNINFVKWVKSFIKHNLPKKLLFLPNIINNFQSGFFQLGGIKNLFKILSMTTCIWLAQGIWAYVLLYSLGLSDTYLLGFQAVIVLIVMMGVAVMIPASPGYIGTFHLMVLLGLTQMGVPKSAALSYAILAHAHAVVVSILVGLLSLWKINLGRSLILANKSAMQ